MAYTKQTWTNGSGGGTPLSAPRLQHLEDGVEAAASTADTASTAAAAAIPATQKGAANGVATLGADSKIPTSQIPALALTTAVPVASQAAMLALTTTQVQPGDVAVRTDGAGTFILTATDPSVLANWTRLNAPTDAVTSVNGQTGTVSLAAANVGAIDSTTLTTKGDILVRTAAGYARLPVGADGQVVTVDSTQTTGLKYSTPATGGGIPATIALSAPTDSITAVTINDDGSATGTWPNRWSYSFKPLSGTAQLVQWVNEYGELRGTPAKVNTVAARWFSKTAPGDTAHSGPVIEVQDDRTTRTSLWSVDGAGNVAAAGNITAGGTVTADNIGAMVLILNAGDPVPAGTPSGTLIGRRPA